MDVPRRVVFSSVCITTATISSFGAIVQLLNWYKRLRAKEPRRIPSPTPHIVFSLALADLFACVGAISMSVLFLTFKPAAEKQHDGEHRKPYDQSYVWIGTPIESFTMFAYISSYMWTLFYSVDICLQVHNKHSCFRSKLYHLMSWPLAAWLVGWGQYAYFGNDLINCSSHDQALVHYMVCYIPLLFVMVALPFIYRKAYQKVSQNIKRNGYFTDAERNVQKSVRKKFCLIVLVFVFCWLPNFIDGIHDVAVYITRHYKGFDHDANHYGLWIIEALVNTQQGFLNCLVYGQHRQFASFCSHILRFGRSDSTGSPNGYHCRTGHEETTINSYSGVTIPVSEISPLLAASRRTLLEPSNSPSTAPFSVKLLGEFAS
ncbi:hypothetical protein OS493_015377 [Desmophyllum pertusum]|uniref:G-protein coupled receptors family 2 profile 2 domain-containing protein n=1 Tax=Desmophyllum pertusum TaxID=174260 RepID=A0A9W9Z0P0_9CNID|nr:hypothetical protein OS493_015377 [Desmophyllum pertusum]